MGTGLPRITGKITCTSNRTGTTNGVPYSKYSFTDEAGTHEISKAQFALVQKYWNEQKAAGKKATTDAKKEKEGNGCIGYTVGGAVVISLIIAAYFKGQDLWTWAQNLNLW